jgi:phosphoribosyl-ATP pyrophosphohydrolase
MISQLFKVIEDRKHNPKADSYTNQLFESGQDRILQKIGEEAVEVILAASNQGEGRIIEEASDLIYHLLVLLSFRGIPLSAIEKEFGKRHHGVE